MRAEQSDDEALERIEERLDALEHTLADLRDQVQKTTNRDIPLLKGTIRALLGDEFDGIDALPDAGRSVRRQFNTQEERLSELEAQLDTLSNIGNESSTKAEKFVAVLNFALNKRSANDKVAITPNEIRGCTGVSRRYAYELIDAMANDLDGVTMREAQRVRTSNGTKRKGKALLVDCEVVHGTNRCVNQFTTGNTDEGGG